MPTLKRKSPSTLAQGFSFFKEYLISEEDKLIKWLWLIGAILCVIAMVGLVFAFSGWFTVFWAVMEAKAISPFLMSLAQFGGLVSAYVLVSSLKNYLVGKFSLSWRNWLTLKFINKLFGSKNNYLELKRTASELANIEQMIQDDVDKYVKLTLALSLDFLYSFSILCTFIGSLWILGGTVIFPGYLVLTAIGIALVASVITYYIGKQLPKINKKSEVVEAEFRQDLAQLTQQSENIAEEHAEEFYKTNLIAKVDEIKQIENEKLNVDTKLTAFQSFNLEFNTIIPYLLAVPLYFNNFINLSQMMQVGFSFGQVSIALNWFVNSYQNISEYKNSINRLTDLIHILESDLNSSPQNITRKVREKESIKVKNLTINKPLLKDSTPLMRGLTFKLNPGEHVMLQGRSGFGKSTLFKVISGSWNYGDGKVSIPAHKKLYILPQEPTIPNNTLRVALAYPETEQTYDDEQYSEVLKKVGLEKFIPYLNEKKSWGNILSGGQKQLLSFARVLLKKPNWLFWDEGTSALDEETEERVFNMAKKIENCTIVSIAHRSTLKKHHRKYLFFKAKGDNCVEIEETYNAQYENLM
ncbi:ABC transporter ATP-binding protein/permease [Legionella yabuuchiae]|uniref:ABC transporter ATP-binding protein/permease n=1 Tax=Legionella yabuuchiae TaxID=376727 RepID=UPI00105495FF|nr:ATP-binding cassette domain-containing protein [Legionella yabuuchiae]